MWSPALVGICGSGPLLYFFAQRRLTAVWLAAVSFADRISNVGRWLDAAADHLDKKVHVVVGLASHLFANLQQYF